MQTKKYPPHARNLHTINWKLIEKQLDFDSNNLDSFKDIGVLPVFIPNKCACRDTKSTFRPLNYSHKIVKKSMMQKVMNDFRISKRLTTNRILRRREVFNNS